ncbi:MAG: Mrp/NBP35 family ATP-binding protein [Thermodesulfobacteriota bacterium]
MAKPDACAAPDAERIAQEAAISANLQHIKNKILVMSGKGGVGKSTVAVNLAQGLANKGFKVGLLDVDLHGPSIPGLLGLKGLAGTTGQSILPVEIGPNLKVISIEVLMPEKDRAVIWRGPVKIGVIRQFIADVEWGSLDYLVVDSPPGTGDEPLTVAQTIRDAKALLVTTPQEVSLADVRKSVNFCFQVGMEIIGVVENMSGLVCPHCGESIDLFHAGGGDRLAELFGLDLLGAIPLAPEIVRSGDAGRPLVDLVEPDHPAAAAYNRIIEQVVRKTSPA